MAPGDQTSTGRLADRIADDLRARIAAGEYRPGDKLPSQNDLAARYEVAKMTAYQAITQLRDQGLVCTRHGSGVYVAEPPASSSLFTVVAAAARSGTLTIDAWAPNARLLVAAMREPLARVVAGLDPAPTGRIRLLVPAADDFDHQFLSLKEDLERVQGVTIERRALEPTSEFGFFLINDADLFVGLSSADHASLPPDVLAQELLHAHSDDTAVARQVQASREWFQHAWSQAA